MDDALEAASGRVIMLADYDEKAIPPYARNNRPRKMKSSIDVPIRQPRYLELDSLRGLAAFIVVLHHLRILWEYDTQPTSATLRFFLDLVNPFGFEAVILFFVLSGFVLSLPAVAGKPQSYPTFLIRRVFRIYVPYLAALAVSIAGAYWLHGLVTRSSWFQSSWSDPVDWHLVFQHLLFIGSYDSMQFDNPIWSLVHEMRISLVFPLLCGIILGLKSKWSFVVAGGLTIASGLLGKLPFDITASVADSIQYAGLFVLGIFLARERARLGDWFRCRPGIARVLIGAAFLWLFLFAGSTFTEAATRLLHIRLHRFLLMISQWITAFGAGGLMIMSMNSALSKRVLHWPSIRLLGQMSYSLYLWHFIVLLFCVHLLYGKTPLWTILCLALVLSIAVSWCSYLWIEKPSMNLGRKLSNVFRSPAGARRSA